MASSSRFDNRKSPYLLPFNIVIYYLREHLQAVPLHLIDSRRGTVKNYRDAPHRQRLKLNSSPFKLKPFAHRVSWLEVMVDVTMEENAPALKRQLPEPAVKELDKQSSAHLIVQTGVFAWRIAQIPVDFAA